MIIFRLFVNGKLASTAGASDLCVLSQTLTAVGKLGPASQGSSTIKDRVEIEVSAGGLTSRSTAPANVHFTWFHSAGLKIGDEVTLQIAEAEVADAPLQPDRDAVERAIALEEANRRKRYESSKKYYLENREKYEG